MSRFLQLHLLTFYPPSNLNRDDVGRPKTAVVGGEPRLRISSQSLKRAWRTSDVFAERLEGHLASRTQRLGSRVEQHLLEEGVAAETARAIAREIAGGFGKVKPETDRTPTYTEQLAFISPEEMEAALALADRRAAGEAADQNGKGVGRLLLRATDTAADIAMFGRMLADNPDFNREAAVQVAHAFTTHRVVIEDDYYTAVDDLKLPSEDAGAGFVGEAGFGSGIFYLYICVDTELLVRNLGGAAGVAQAATEALIEASAKVGPRGKQASYASRATTSYAMLEFGSEQPRTLAAAFVRPVDRLSAGEGSDLLERSIGRLEAVREDFDRAYGIGDLRRAIMNVPGRDGALSDLLAFARDAIHA